MGSVRSKWAAVVAAAACAVAVACGPDGDPITVPVPDADSGAGDASVTVPADSGITLPFPDAGAPPAKDAGGSSAPDSSAPPAEGGPGSDGGDAAPPPVTGTTYDFGASVDPGSCLSAIGAGTSAGTGMEERSCDATGAQSFTAVDAGGGVVSLVNTHAGRCLDVADGGTANGTRVQLADCNPAAAQKYELEDAGGGLVSIVETGSKKCLDIEGGNPADGTTVQLYDCNQTAAQRWNPAPIGAGFTASCGIADLQAGVVLGARCWNESAALVSSTLDLNSCVTNTNGALGWETNGGFAGSCSNCVLTGASMLTCQCNDVSAQSHTTTLDLSADVNNCNGVLTCGACGTGTVSTGPTAFTGLYGSDGNDFYQFTGSSSVANLKTSGWNVVFMFGISIQSNGDLVHSGATLVHAGAYVGDPSWGSNVAALKMPPSSVTRYEVTVGGWGDGSFDSIKSLVGSQGTAAGSTLYQNLQALKNAVPGIDAINDDDEQTYDVASSTAFGQMLQGLGMKLSLVPYMNQSVWVQLKSNLGSEVDVVYLQCYQGGAGNDPGQWDSAFGGGFHVVPGQESNNHSASWWQGWSSADGVTGGFYWPDVTWAPGANWGVSEIAGGLGLPPE